MFTLSSGMNNAIIPAIKQGMLHITSSSTTVFKNAIKMEEGEEEKQVHLEEN